MDKIVPNLWFDREAAEAAALYVSLFDDSHIDQSIVLHNPPDKDTTGGDSEFITLTLAGQTFMFLSAGPVFRINPSISFFINCETAAEVQRYYDVLSPGGKELMPLAAYPFSDKYAWIEDRYGVNWQIMYRKDGPILQKLVPALMFTGANAGRAKEAIAMYRQLFKEEREPVISYYGEGDEWNKPGTVSYAEFELLGKKFTAMDSGYDHGFTFNEAISFLVNCENQEEIDYYWDRLSAVPEAEQCGWLKDKFGLSWQICPTVLSEMMAESTPEQLQRLTEAILPMKKLDQAALIRVYEEAAQ